MLEPTLKSIFYVYVYLDPRKPGKFIYGQYEFDYEPFYVGKGSKKRFKSHLLKYNLKRDPNKLKVNIINDIVAETGNPPIIIKLKDNLKETEAFGLELNVVDIIGRKNLKTGPLTNLVPGGDGGQGGSSNPNFGNRWDENQKENLRIQKIKHDYKLISPNNEIFYTNNLSKFCRDNMLGIAHMNTVVLGKSYQHKGWKGYIVGKEYLRIKIEENHTTVGKFIRNPSQIEKHVRGSLKYEYVLKSPFGEIYTTNNLNQFCKDNFLYFSAMQNVVHGKLFHSKGWTGYIKNKEHLRETVNKKNDVYCACSPTGVYHENIIVFKYFCEEHKIGKVRNVLNRIKNVQLYKGWTFFKESVV